MSSLYSAASTWFCRSKLDLSSRQWLCDPPIKALLNEIPCWITHFTRHAFLRYSLPFHLGGFVAAFIERRDGVNLDDAASASASSSTLEKDASEGAEMAALFWGAFMVGRMTGILVSLKISPQKQLAIDVVGSYRASL